MVTKKQYKLVDEHGSTYLSIEPGKLGGYRRSKIFGRLDCKTASRAIAKGGYVSQRVFFKDEETAIKAGCRPCARCLPEKYAEWKQEKEMPDVFENIGLMKYEFTAKPFLYQGDTVGGWYFVSPPIELAKEIRGNHKWQEEGWGRMKATVKIGGIEWKTSIWFDTKHDTYLLPLKAEIRRKEKIEIDEDVEVVIWV
jgi:hypothetical protein